MSRAPVAIVLGLALAAAARAQTPATAPAPTTAMQSVPLYNFPGNTMYARLDTIGTAVTVAGPKAQAFHALRGVYAELQVPVADADSAAGWLGALHLTRTYSLGRMRMSSALDCGSGMSGPVADDARIQMALVTFVVPAGADSTSVRTAVVAQSQSLGGEQSDRVLCNTKGYLEDWIVQRLRRQLARP